MGRRLIVNRAQCLVCGDILISRYRHEFISCSCKECPLFVDGGSDYLKRSGNPVNIKDMSLYTDDNFEEIRKWVYRGCRGKEGTGGLNWIRLCDISDDHLNNLLKYKVDNKQTDDVHFWAYKEELNYRGGFVGKSM